METDKFKNDLMIGETSSVEFKRCGNKVEHSDAEAAASADGFLADFGEWEVRV